MPAAAWPHPFDPFRPAPSSAAAAEAASSRKRLAPDGALTIRHARPDDAAALADLAALDSTKPLRGDVLVAVIDDRPVAALELSGDRAIADPFRPSETAVEMLRVRADQLRAGAPVLRAHRRHGTRTAGMMIR